MADYLPLFKPGATITGTASAAITGGRLLEVTGANTYAHAGLASVKVVGVAGQDTAIGDHVTIHRGGVQRLVAAGVVAAGAVVQAGATGQVVAGTTAPIGIALTAAAQAGDVIDVAIN